MAYVKSAMLGYPRVSEKVLVDYRTSWGDLDFFSSFRALL